jgi:hypothetical protein
MDGSLHDRQPLRHHLHDRQVTFVSLTPVLKRLPPRTIVQCRSFHKLAHVAARARRLGHGAKAREVDRPCRAVSGDQTKLQSDPHFRDRLLFYAYFHGPGAATPSVNPGTTNMGR